MDGWQASYSIDENLYHTSYESGLLEDPMVSPPPEMFKMTTDPQKVGTSMLGMHAAPMCRGDVMVMVEMMRKSLTRVLFVSILVVVINVSIIL